MKIEARLRLERGDFVLDAALSVPERGVSAIYGPSGSGKTTLLRAIAGLERAAVGRLQVGPEIWQDDRIFVAPHRRSLGYVFQEASLFSHLSVRRNLEYGYRRVPEPRRRVTFEAAVHLLGLGALLDRSPEDLSGGERQRIAVARALLTSPRLLLMDEPLTGLDVESKSEILPYLDELHEELDIPVLYVSHSPEEVARLADYLVLLEKGTTVASGPIGEILTRFDLPLCRSDDAGAIVEARVIGHDEIFHLTHLEFAGGRLHVTREDLERGREVRLRIFARDVSLTTSRQENTSILNILPVSIEELTAAGPSQMMVRLSAGGTPILSRITRKSASALDLQPGKRLYAQVKSVALLI